MTRRARIHGPLRRSLDAVLVAALGVVPAACSSGEGGATTAGPDPGAGVDILGSSSTVEGRLARTIQDLAALGNKRAGSEKARAAAEMIFGRFTAAGLDDVRFEEFRFPAFDLVDSQFAAAIDGGPSTPIAHDVLYYSGAGQVEADVVDLGFGQPPDYEGVDVTGKVCLVVRKTTYHRTSQFRECAAHGGAAMLFVGLAPGNLIQVGTVTNTPEMGPIPAITIGTEDAAVLRNALAAHRSVRVALSVTAALSPAIGRNVVGALPGTDPSGAYILIGAHYDSWFVGASDNGTGTAALLELVRALSGDRDRRWGVVFVAYDGEEIGLYGGYDYLRDHVVAAGEPMLAFFNLETPATGPDDLRAVAHSNQDELAGSLELVGMPSLYPFYLRMEQVPVLFGGIIPTDIQGMYRTGLAGFSTACDTPYYHTVEDTPEKVDVDFLARSVEAFERMLPDLDGTDAAPLRLRDPALWSVEVRTEPSGSDLVVDITASNEVGAPAPGAAITVFVEVDDFTRAYTATATADSGGRATLTVPAGALTAGSGSRWLDVTAGVTYPLVEYVAPLP